MSFLPWIWEEVMTESPATGEVAEWEESPHFKGGEAASLGWRGRQCSECPSFGKQPFKRWGPHSSTRSAADPELSGPGSTG